MRSRKGLTLIELLIVVIILGALAAIAIPRITTSATTARRNACTTNVDTINTAIEMFHIDSTTDAWPTLLTEVTKDVNYFPDGEPRCPIAEQVYDSYYVGGTTNRVVHSHP